MEPHSWELCRYKRGFSSLAALWRNTDLLTWVRTSASLSGIKRPKMQPSTEAASKSSRLKGSNHRELPSLLVQPPPARTTNIKFRHLPAARADRSKSNQSTEKNRWPEQSVIWWGSSGLESDRSVPKTNRIRYKRKKSASTLEETNNYFWQMQFFLLKMKRCQKDSRDISYFFFR